MLWYCNVYNQIHSDVWETSNPVYRLTIDKLQPVLINLLNRAICKHLSFHKVVQ